MNIPVFQPVIDQTMLKAFEDALHVGWLGMGAFTLEFEKKIETFLGLNGRRVMATNTGTSALHLALRLAELGPGDEVIVSSFNFVADHQAIVAAGAQPVFCDITDDDLGMDPKGVEELIGPRTKAILPLHFAGRPCRIDAIFELAKKRQLRVIEDATHAFGSSHSGKKIGSFGDIACFSFDPVKVVTSIDGGAVVVNSESELQRLRYMRFLGIDKETAERYKNQRAWEYDVVAEGYRYHLTNVLARVGISQLERVDQFIASRQESCRMYNRLLSGIDGLQLPPTDFMNVSPFIYTIRVRPDRRLGLIDHLKQRGIATGVHFLPAHQFTFFKNARRGALPMTERAANEIITLPLHSLMDPSLVNRIAQEVRGFLTQSK